ncbi:MAG: hypothetical protein RL380_1727, partial [Verrucomicrobiota bacterium]
RLHCHGHKLRLVVAPQMLRRARLASSCANTSITAAAGKLRCTVNARHSRVNSSTTHKYRNFSPSLV